MMTKRILLWVSAVVLALTSHAAFAQDTFYAGKTINLVVGFPPGGGNDLYSRLLARHLGRHIPGNPTIVVQNMPGAASLTAVRALDTNLPKDGTAIVAFTPGLVIQSITSPEKTKVDFTQFSWLGSLSRDFRVCYTWNATGIRTWDDLAKKREVVMGETGTGSGFSFVTQRILQKALDVNLKQILGYPGSAEKRIAIERGELDGDCGIWETIPSDWLRDKKISVILRFQDDDVRGREANAPYVGDLVKNPDKKKVIELLNVSGEFGRPYILSREVPADRLKVLRDAFDKAVKDPAFLDDAEKQKLGISPISGTRAEEVVKAVSTTPPAIVAAAKDILGE